MRFFSHNGFDDAEIKAALQDAWEEKALPRGASTITQQVAKNLWLSGSYNPLRKVKEAILTRQLERHLAKRRILELYLNCVELGPGIYGAEAAARHYYGRSAARPHRAPGRRAGRQPARPQSWHPGFKSRGYQRPHPHRAAPHGAAPAGCEGKSEAILPLQYAPVLKDPGGGTHAPVRFRGNPLHAAGAGTPESWPRRRTTRSTTRCGTASTPSPPTSSSI